MAELLVICEKETVFVQILSEYLKKKYGEGMEIQAFDNVDKLLLALKETKITLCLMGEGLLQAYQLEELLQRTEHILYFSGKRKRDSIFKFQSVEQVAKDLLHLCEEKNISIFEEQSFFTDKEDVKIISFYSPHRHILQSSLAVTMGQILAREKKVLYLNFEPYSGFEYMMQKTYENELMDIFFFLKEDKGKFRMRLEGMMESVGNLDYIPPAFCYPDMVDIELSLWQKLLQRIMTEMNYDVLLLDLTEQTRGLFSLLEVSDEIYTYVEEDGLILAKVRQYEKLLIHMNKEKILEHTKKCIVPVFRDIPKSANMFTHCEMAGYIKKTMSDAMGESLEEVD